MHRGRLANLFSRGRLANLFSRGRLANPLRPALRPPPSPGELQEPSKKAIHKHIHDQDQLVDNAKNGTSDEGQPR